MMLDRPYNLAGNVLFYGGILFLGGLAGIVWVVRKARACLRLSSPPFLPDDLEQATYPEMRRYVKYLVKTCRRLSDDQDLDSEDRKTAAGRADDLAETLIAHPLLDDLIRAIDETESKVLFPLLDKLSRLAHHEVDDGVEAVSECLPEQRPSRAVREE